MLQAIPSSGCALDIHQQWSFSHVSCKFLHGKCSLLFWRLKIMFDNLRTCETLVVLALPPPQSLSPLVSNITLSWNGGSSYLLPLCIGQPKLFASTLQTLCLASCRVRPWNCATTCTMPPFRDTSIMVFEKTKLNKAFGSRNIEYFRKVQISKMFPCG